MFNFAILADFYNKSREEIAKNVNGFVESVVFKECPDIVQKAAILLAGSVGLGDYDRYSDIDLTIIFYKQEDKERYKLDLLKSLKNIDTTPKYPPLELHGKHVTTIDELTEKLAGWRSDWLLAEFKEAIILHDPQNAVAQLKQAFDWYPKDVYSEKVNYLFAESTFLLFNRYDIAAKRQNELYALSVKVDIINWLIAALLMAIPKYPAPKKHLLGHLKKQQVHTEIVQLIETIINDCGVDSCYIKLNQLRSAVEKVLLDKKLIDKKEVDEWLSMRFEHKVNLG